ncbi:MAG: methyl-accepting chemotaxis protein [Trueperaceae bacterium]|nr:methyl-accepting chemotaxis protein [Trueperaceae bacterium]
MSADTHKLFGAQAQETEEQVIPQVLEEDELEVLFDNELDDDFDLKEATSIQELMGQQDAFRSQSQGSQVPQENSKGFFARLFKQTQSDAYNPYQTSQMNTQFGTAFDDALSIKPETMGSQNTETSPIKPSGRLSSKLIVALVSLILVSLGAAGFSTIYQVRKSLLGQITDSRQVQTQSIVDLTKAFFIEEVQPLEALSSNHAISNALIYRNQSYSGSEAEILAGISYLDGLWQSESEGESLRQSTLESEQNSVSKSLNGFLKRFPEHSELFVTDIYGATLGTTGRLSDYYQADESWWQAAWNQGKGAYYISQPEFDESSETSALLIAFPIWDESRTQIVGIMRSTLVLDKLISHITDHQFGESGYAMLFNAQGKALIDPGLERGSDANQLSPELRQSFVSSNAGSEIKPDEKGINAIFTFAKILPDSFAAGTELEDQIMAAVAKLNWSIVTRQESNEALMVLNTILTWTIAVGGITLLLALLIATGIARSISRPIQQLAFLANQVAQGDLSQLAEIRSNDEVGYLGHSMNTAILRLRRMVRTEEELELERQERENLQANIANFLDIAMDIAQGDLTQRGQVTEDVLGNVVDAINLMVEEVAYLLRDVQTAALSVNEGSEAMLKTTEAITSSTQKQALEAQKARHEVIEVSSSIREMAENARVSAQSAEQTLKASQEGQSAVTNTLDGMQNIRREVQAIAKRIKSLGDRSLEISEIVDTIARISRQTNLLALNAAIEASGAGEAGRRFAIVADEVRKLADDSALATRRIAELIKGVQAEVQEVVISVEDGTKEVEQGYRVATAAGERLKEISSISERSAQLAQLISSATQAQVSGVGDVDNAVAQMTAMAEASQSSIEQGKDVAKRLQELSEQLTQSLERFRLA